ncbi:MAG: amidohydrolase family protein [Deltaproteobacteria bacterium]|nr:amidohydrolase family protein [Deltaproteobacteria bacterium]
MVKKVLYDLIFKGGGLVDPVGGFKGDLDLAVLKGRVERVQEDLNPDLAKEVIEVKGLVLVPGLIDPHVHASNWLGGPRAHAMLAKAGVTTALDMSGPTEKVLKYLAQYGLGLNLACLEYLRPGHTLTSDHPGLAELSDCLDRALKAGAIGLKILGGHYPLTAEASQAAIELSAERGTYLAFHAGSQNARSDLNGLIQALELAGQRPMHLAHINSYCRGYVKPCLEETAQALKILEKRPRVFSESYLSPINGTSGEIAQGLPTSQVTIDCLNFKGYPPTAQGLERAILEGWAMVHKANDSEVSLATGTEGLEYWRDMKSRVGLSFSINPPQPRMILATAKKANGDFAVSAISTDGGGIPRNVTAFMGLALVRLGALSLEEFVWKSSYAPALALGLSAHRGHLAPGAWADITGLDLKLGQAVLTVVSGQVIANQGKLGPVRGGKVITTPQGEKAVKAHGLRAELLRPEDRPFFARPGSRPGLGPGQANK